MERKKILVFAIIVFAMFLIATAIKYEKLKENSVSNENYLLSPEQDILNNLNNLNKKPCSEYKGESPPRATLFGKENSKRLSWQIECLRCANLFNTNCDRQWYRCHILWCLNPLNSVLLG